MLSVEVDAVDSGYGEDRVVNVLGARPVVVDRVPQTSTGHVDALVLALTDDDVADEFVTFKAEPFHFMLDHRAQLTRQGLDLFRVVRDVLQVDTQDILDGAAHGRRPELMTFVRFRFVRVLQFRFRFRIAPEQAAATHAQHHADRLDGVAQATAAAQGRLDGHTSARVGGLRRHDGDSASERLRPETLLLQRRRVDTARLL